MIINTDSYGTLNPHYVKRIQDTIDKALNDYPRTMILRVDLRLPEMDNGLYNFDSGIVTRFTVSLKAQIEADLLKKNIQANGFIPVVFVISGQGSLIITEKNITTLPCSLTAKLMHFPGAIPIGIENIPIIWQ